MMHFRPLCSSTRRWFRHHPAAENIWRQHNQLIPFAIWLTAWNEGTRHAPDIRASIQVPVVVAAAQRQTTGRKRLSAGRNHDPGVPDHFAFFQGFNHAF